MADMKKPRLTGGTLLTLILEARKRGEVQAAEMLSGKRSEITIPDIINGLVKIVDPEHKIDNPASASTSGTKYKQCEIEAPGWTGVTDSSFISSFRSQMKSNYSSLLKNADGFIRFFLDINSKPKMDFLGQAILELICSDPEIPDNLPLPIEGPTVPKTKEYISKHKFGKYNLQMVLLAAWYYVVAKRVTNTDGLQTYRCWHTEEKDGKAVIAKKPVFNIGQEFESALIIVLSSDDCNMSHQGVSAKTADEQSAALQADYSDYMSKAADFYGSLKTILYKEAVPFYDFYVQNRMYEGNVIGDLVFHALDEVFGWGSEDSQDNDGFTMKPKSVFGAARRYGNCFAITATGGMGKSMTMRHFFLGAIKLYQEAQTKGSVPVFVPLKEYKDSYDSIADFAFAQIKRFSKIKKEDFLETLELGRVVLLLDGLDEVPEGLRTDFIEKLNDITNHYSSNIFVLSTRPSDSILALQRFREVCLMPFTLQEALELIDKLEWRPEEPDLKAEFKKNLKDKYWSEQREFAQNPLLLTIMLMTFDQYHNIPDRMYRFYEYAYATLSEKHDAMKALKRGMKTELDPGSFQRYLEAFCAITYAEEKYEFSRIEIERYFDETLDSLDQKDVGFSWKDFLDDLKDNLCLLYYESNKYHFVHRSFQEYFAACYFAKQKDDDLWAIADFFEQRKGGQRGDQTFGMLYEMIPEKIEQFVFIPYLRGILFLDEPNDEFDFPIGFRKYVQKAFPKMIWSCGDTDEDYYVDSPLYLYNFIWRHATNSRYRTVKIDGPVPEDEMFVTDRFIRVGSDDEEDIMNVESMSISVEDDEDYDQALLDLYHSATGWLMSAPTEILYQNYDKYCDVIDCIEESELFEEYRDLKDYLVRLEEKSVHRDDNIRRLIFGKKK